MTFVSGNIPNLINGVSQQPDTLRNPTQAQVQINALSTAASGLRKRPEFVGVARSATPRNGAGEYVPNIQTRRSAVHFINRDGVERYAVQVVSTAASAGVLVTDLQTGVVSTASGFGADYLYTDDASRDIRFLTVADTTFILNKAKVVAKGVRQAAPSFKNASYAYVVAGNYGKRYEINLNYNGGSGNFWYDTATGGSPADSLTISTDTIATNLETQFNTLKAGALLAQWPNLYCVRYGSVLVFYALVQGDINITSKDGFGGHAMSSFGREVSNFSDLPPTGSPLMPPIRVAGDEANDFRGYFVKFKGAVGGEGVWEEVPDLFNDRDGDGTGSTDYAYGVFDTNTMPHQLVITPGSAVFGTVAWSPRLAGDSLSAPDPGFVGKKINGMFFHKSRLGFLSQDGVIMSAADDFFRFYPRRVASVLDNDPIDVRSNSSFVDDFYHAVSFDEKLVVWGGRSQYTVRGEPLLTPRTVEINLVSAYEASRTCQPVSVGRRIFFPFNRQGYTGVSEFFVDENNNVDAQEVTGQVPEYIPKDAYQIASAANESCVAVVAGDRKSIYIYRYYVSGQEKLMSSWSQWTTPWGTEPDAVINGIGFIEGRLYLMASSSRGVVTGYYDLAVATPEAEPFRVHLDSKWAIAVSAANGAYDSISDTTLVKVPHPYKFKARSVYLTGPDTGRVTNLSSWVYLPSGYPGAPGDYIAVSGNAIGQTIVVGEPYAFGYTLSTIFVRTQSPTGATVADTRAHLMLRNIQFVYENTHQLTALVKPESRGIYQYQLNAGDEDVPLADGLFRFPIGTKNRNTTIALYDDSPYSVQLLSASWEAVYSKRSKGT